MAPPTNCFRQHFAGLNDLTIVGTDADDQLRVSFAAGNPIPTGGLSFDGGEQSTATGDVLVLDNGQATTVLHSFDNESDGAVEVDGVVISYTGLEPVIDNLNAADRIFTFNGGAETITLADDVTANNNISQIDSTLGEVVSFVNPTNSLTINSGSGIDLIDVDMVDQLYAASLIVNGGAEADTLDVDDLSIVDSPGRGLQINSTESVTINDSPIQWQHSDRWCRPANQWIDVSINRQYRLPKQFGIRQWWRVAHQRRWQCDHYRWDSQRKHRSRRRWWFME